MDNWYDPRFHRLMVEVNRNIAAWLRKRITNDVIRRKPVIARIRHEFALLGYDMSDLTDEDIRQGILHMSEVFQSYDVTAEEATKALTDLYHGV